MKTTNEYLDQVKQKLRLDTDYKLAKWLGSKTSVISKYRLKQRVMDNYTAAKLAEALGIDPMEVIAAAEAEREKDERKAEFWRKLMQKMSVAAAIAAFLAFPINDLQAGGKATQHALCAIASRLKKAWRQALAALAGHGNRRPA